MGGELLKRISDFLARLPGLPIILAVGLIALNFVLQLLPAQPVVGWLARTHLFLHLGLILGFLGLLVGEAL
ncbi:MAG TPA: hypothetical protein G4N97_00555 [Thermoflexia bacterium]|nr:MAG: hypothetical protein DRI80_00395 [Chloroflexota bacterium]HEY66746.1 hypothetical protein [Thermoflexia bacterium]